MTRTDHFKMLQECVELHSEVNGQWAVGAGVLLLGEVTGEVGKRPRTNHVVVETVNVSMSSPSA